MVHRIAQHGAVHPHMLFRVILQCETPTKFTPEPRPRRVGPKRRGRARESGSRFVDMDDQWTFQCQFQNPPPLRGETSTDETTPNPDRPRPHLGRNRALAYGPVCFPHSALWSVRHVCQCQTYDSESQCGARRVSSGFRQCH